MHKPAFPSLAMRALLGAAVLACASQARADDGGLDNTGMAPLSTGQFITPTYATGSTISYLNPGLPDHPGYHATHAVRTLVSPDGSTLLVMTSGYNLLADASGAAEPSASNEYVFVYDVSGGREAAPVQKQAIKVPNTYCGLVFSPDGTKFYVSGGNSDAVFVYSGSTAAGWSLSATIPFKHPDYGAALAGTPYAAFSVFALTGLGLAETASVSGLGISSDGLVLVAANIYNDSIDVIDTPTNTIRYEYDLRPYLRTNENAPGLAGGEVPFGVAVKGDGVAYVSSIRDRQVTVVDLVDKKLIARIALPGAPNSVLLDAAQARLYVTQDDSDSVAVIDTATNAVIEEISTIAPPGILPLGDRAYTGAAANNLAFSPDGGTLYVTNGGANSLAIIPLSGPAPHAVSALVPTGWYPNSVSVSRDGSMLYVADGKSDPGSDPLYTVGSANEYILQREAGTLLTVPAPAATDYAQLTAQVAANNGYSVPANPADAAVMAALRSNIQHVIYIVRENRTFDQVLGDLANGANADPALVMFGRNITPSIHRLASQFVTLDNFFDSGEVSGNGWAWSTEARESDHGVKSIPPNYANRGASNDSEGTNRNVDVGLSGVTARTAGEPLYPVIASVFPGGAANLLPGTNDDFATDGPAGAPVQQGYIWDAALRAGLSVRNYGFFIDVARYTLDGIPGLGLSLVENPAVTGATVAYPTNPTLAPVTDPYFRGFDNVYPDVWREEEWAREFAIYDATKTLPNLTLLRLMHDHQGNFGTAIGGLTTPETQVADNDVAVGRVIDAVAHSKNYSGNTLIFVVEDDAQDGDDHMDAHRSVAFVVGPYVKHNAVVSTRYSTVNMVRTIEDVLGIGRLNLNDAYQGPMTNVFDLNQKTWTFTAVASSVLQSTVAMAHVGDVQFAGEEVRMAHDGAWWAEKTRGFDFSAEDRVPTALFNEVLWEGIVGDRPYPHERSGRIIRAAAHTSND